MIDTVVNFIHIIMHLNLYLGALFNAYGGWIFALICLIIYCETGLVVTPFLPGDSLLFATGAVIAASNINPLGWPLLLFLAAFAGDNTNYLLGRLLGAKVYNRHSRLFKREHLVMAEKFYQQYGAMAIFIGRFLPIFRTFVPFIAGIARMQYRLYISWCLLSALVWVGVFFYFGYFFGSIPWVQTNFALVIAAVILVSMLPGIIATCRHLLANRKRNLRG